MQTFRVNVVPAGETCTLMLSGEADLAFADDIVQLGTLALTDAGTQSIVIDLAAVTFLDSTVLGALVRLRIEATEAGKTLTLGNPPPRVQRILSISGLANVFDI